MRSLRQLLAIVVVAVLLAGCSSAGVEQGPLVPPAAAAEVAPVHGGILRLAIERPAHLDPARARSVPQSELVVADLLYDGLTAYDAAAGEAVPAVASGWQVDEALTTWRFTIDPEARFADGRSVTAADVEASLERIAGGGPDSPGARLLAPVLGVGEVATGVTEDVAGVAVEGDDVVLLTLDRPLSSLPELLASPLLGIAPAGVSADALAELPHGSGPFRLAAGAAGEGPLLDQDVLRLERVPDGTALVAGIDLVLVEGAATAVDLVGSGEADVAFVPTDVGTLDESFEEVTAPFAAELFYGLNLGHPALADPQVRAAVVAAVDRRAIIDDVYAGALQPLHGVVPEGIPGAAPGPCGASCEHDPDWARATIAEAFPDGRPPELVVDVDAGARQEAVAAAIAADLVAVGIPASVRVHDIDEYPAFLARGAAGIFRLGWSGGWHSAGAYLPPLFGSGAPANVVGMAEPAVDEALDRAAATADPGERDAAYAAAEALILEELAILPIGQFRTRLAVGERVRDLELSVMGTFDATAVHLVRQR